MNAAALGFPDRFFDCVICIQNGMAVFDVEPKKLLQESIRVTKIRGTLFFSSYSDKIWDERLNWFKLQSEAGLLGEIDGSSLFCKITPLPDS